jgi:hypothetical protein
VTKYNHDGLTKLTSSSKTYCHTGRSTQEYCRSKTFFKTNGHGAIRTATGTNNNTVGATGPGTGDGSAKWSHLAHAHRDGTQTHLAGVGACCLVASGGSRSSCRYKTPLRSLQLQPRLLALSRVIASHLLLEKTHARPRGPSAAAARDKRKLTPQLQPRPATPPSPIPTAATCRFPSPFPACGRARARV